MPAFSPQLALPPPPISEDPEAFRVWAESLTRTLGNAWREMVYVLDAQSIVDTLVNRSATPALDHIFFTASDTGEVFVAVNGAWVAVNTLRLGGSNGQLIATRQLTELHTLTHAGTSDTTIQFPANSLGLGVGIRVTTLITGCTSLDVGIAGATTRYGTGIALAAGTTNASVGTTNPSIYGAATKIRFTAVGGGASFSAGVVRTTIDYIDVTAPAS
jgi:hypothetical protein